jgi:MFS family permease
MEIGTNPVSEDLLPGPANAFGVPDFRRLWANNLLFLFVSNGQRFAFGWLVLDGLGRDERWQGFIAFAVGLPVALVVLQAGALADRVDRRKLLFLSQGLLAIVVAITVVMIAADALTLGWAIVLAVASGAAQALGQPVRISLVPMLVPEKLLFNAIALNAIAMTMSMILSAPLIKLAGDLWGFEGAFGIQLALLVVGAVFLLRLEPPPVRETERRRLIVEIREAIGHVIHDLRLRVLFMLLGVGSLTVSAAVMVTLQAYVKEDLGRDGGDVAFPLMLMGVGIATSSAFVMRRGNMRRKGAAFQRAMMCGSAAVFVMGRTTEFWQLLPLTFLMGLAGGFFINMNQGLIQSSTPKELMGRVMGLYTLVQFGLMPFGALVLGWASGSVGAGAVISACGAIAFTVTFATYLTSVEVRNLD